MINTCNKQKYFNKTEKFCPTGFVFFTNVCYGLYKQYENCYIDETVKYQAYINKLKLMGYTVQVVDAFDIDNNHLNWHEKMILAIYIKKSDGSSFN